MKKLRIWYTLTLSLLLGFISCEKTEDFDNDPKVEIVIDNEEGSAFYKFEAKTIGVDDDTQMIWSIDGNVVDLENEDIVNTYVFDYLFKLGSHKVCVTIVTDGLTIETCEEIEVEVDCPDYTFRIEEMDVPNAYNFIPEFEVLDGCKLEYYINNELILDSWGGAWDSHYFAHRFESEGEYEVCLKVTNPNSNCPEGKTFCKTITIERDAINNCPDLYFEISDSGNLYPKTPQGIVEDTVFWYIDGELKGKSSGKENHFCPTGIQPGTYEVCARLAETPDCPNGIEFCKTIDIIRLVPIGF